MNYDYDCDQTDQYLDIDKELAQATRQRIISTKNNDKNNILTLNESNDSDVFEDPTGSSPEEISGQTDNPDNTLKCQKPDKNTKEESREFDTSTTTTSNECVSYYTDLMHKTLDRLWFTPVFDEDKEIVNRICEIRSKLRKIESFNDLLNQINKYIDNGNDLPEESFFLICNLYIFDERFYKNYRLHAFDNNIYSGQGSNIEQFILSFHESV